MILNLDPAKVRELAKKRAKVFLNNRKHFSPDQKIAFEQGFVAGFVDTMPTLVDAGLIDNEEGK